MRRIEHPQVEMQIAPLIDVCFLLLFFYILTSKPDKPEGDLNLRLPGSVDQEVALDFPDEQRIEIHANGQVVLNEEPMDRPENRDMPRLRSVLTRYKEAAMHNRSKALVTIWAADDAVHQRIVDVLNACAQASITEVTFAGVQDAAP